MSGPLPSSGSTAAADFTRALATAPRPPIDPADVALLGRFGYGAAAAKLAT